MNASDVLNQIRRRLCQRLREREYRRLQQGAPGKPRWRLQYSGESVRKLMSLPALAFLLLLLWYCATVPDARLAEERRLAAQANMPRSVDSGSPVYEMASVLASRGWELVQCDRVPAAYAPPNKCYRALLRCASKEFVDAGDDTLTLTKRMHMDLMFFPLEEAPSSDIKSRIRWEDVEQRKPPWLDVDGPIGTFDMGEANGYRVIGRMTIPQQELVRRALGLSGGDDRIALIESRLAQCTDSPSYWRTLRLLKDCGPEAVPLIQRALDTSRYRSRAWLLSVLFEMPDEESWRTVHAFYERPETRKLVATVLSESPWDPRWKDAYLRMIEGDPSESYVIVGLDAAAAFAWREALPLVAKVKAAPQCIAHYVAACKAERRIDGNPLASGLDEAVNRIRVMDDFRRARNVNLDLGPPGREQIIQSSDEEGAILAAIEIAATQTEGPFLSADNTGIAILLKLPQEPVLRTLRHLASATQDEQSRSDACDILEAILNEGARKRT